MVSKRELFNSDTPQIKNHRPVRDAWGRDFMRKNTKKQKSSSRSYATSQKQPEYYWSKLKWGAHEGHLWMIHHETESINFFEINWWNPKTEKKQDLLNAF